jgi:3-phosphoglycerate kinase
MMRESKNILDQLHAELQTPEEHRYWNGSIDELKRLSNMIDNIELKNQFLFKIEILIHQGRKKQKSDSVFIPYFKKIILDFALDFNEISNTIKDELTIHPTLFDIYTKQALNDKELTQYKNEQNKKKDEYYKKLKKKMPLKPEEEEKELNDYKAKMATSIKEKIMDMLKNVESDKYEYLIDDLILNSYLMDDEYVDRLNRIKCLKNVKKDGLEGKTIIVRVDVEEYEQVYEPILNEENQKIGETLKEIKFPNAKDTILQTVNFLLDNRVKAVLLLFEFGPKLGTFNENFQAKFLRDYLEREGLVEQTINLLPELSDLNDLQMKIDSDEVFKENSLLIFENLNFFMEECNEEIENDTNLTTTPGGIHSVKYYNKLKFVNLLSLRQNEPSNLTSYANQVFIQDSNSSIMKKYPSVIDMQNDLRCLGLRLESQLHKFTNFISINSNNYMMIIGDLDNDENLNDSTILKTLLTINTILNKFKRILILGKVGILFIHFIQNDYIIDPKFKVNPVFHKLMKYILIRADSNGTNIMLPEDGIFLSKEEYSKFKPGFILEIQPEINQENEEEEVEPIVIDDYYKYIKKLFKMEKRLEEIESLKLDPEELLEHEDYIKNKLTENEIELLKNYKNNNFEFKSEEYKRNFVELQQNQKPKKTLKNEYEVRKNLEYIYNKPIVFNENNEHSLNNSLVNMSQQAIEGEPINKKFNCVFDCDNNVFVDYGEKTYNKLIAGLKEMNTIMWLGKLSPSIVENLNDNYYNIVNTMNDRNKELKEKYNEMFTEEERKPESDIKAKKYLFTIFLKSKTSYDLIRRNFLSIKLPNEDKDAEVHPDEEQFNYDMNSLIDYNVSDDCELVNSLMRGEHIPGIIFLFILGLFSLCQDPIKDNDQEIDLKFLEEIF